MILRNNSKNLMDRFGQAEADIKTLDTKLAELKTNLENKTAVVNQSQTYIQYLLAQVQEKNSFDSSDRIVFANEDNIISGAYGIYGQTIHPRFLSVNNIFNFSTSMGPAYKDVANVTINNTSKKQYADILKDDAISDQQPVFDMYQTNAVTIDIEIPSDSTLIDREFNVIELCPFLPGSFDIQKILITEQDDVDYDYPGVIPKCGCMRICFPNKFKLKKITFVCQLNYQANGSFYPFGFRHIYFLDVDYADSSIIIPITKKSYINYISEEITVHDQYGTHSTAEDTCTHWGIRTFMYFNNNILENEITPLYGANQSYLSRNIKTIYLQIPIQTSLFSLEFRKIDLR